VRSGAQYGGAGLTEASPSFAVFPKPPHPNTGLENLLAKRGGRRQVPPHEAGKDLLHNTKNNK
jgi:hypothetical protein